MSSNILHFANVHKSNTCKKWAPPHTSLNSTKSLSGLSLLLRFCYKFGLWQSSILMPNSLFEQLWCNLICVWTMVLFCVCTSPQRHFRCLWPTVAVSTILCLCTVHYWAPVVLVGGGQPVMVKWTPQNWITPPRTNCFINKDPLELILLQIWTPAERFGTSHRWKNVDLF